MRKAKTPGRPAFRPTAAQRRVVTEMRFCGESHSIIARALGINRDTLAKHFHAELETGHAVRRREVIGLLFRAARGGNVSATKKLEEIGRTAGAAEAVQAREAAPPRLGKKEEKQAAAEALVKTGRFATPPPPRMN